MACCQIKILVCNAFGLKIYSFLHAIRICFELKLMVRFEVFTAVAMKNAIFWDVTPCGSCKNLQRASVAILVTLMMEAIHSSETSVLIRATLRNIPEDSIF
jgi:hypothetical protein